MKIHPHMLRNACGFKLANEGVDTRTIQAYLGHKSIQHTVRYTEYRAGAHSVQEPFPGLMPGAGSRHWLAHDITAAIPMAGNRAEIRLTSTAWASVPLGRCGAAGPLRPPRTAKQPNASPLLGRASTVQLA